MCPLHCCYPTWHIPAPIRLGPLSRAAARLPPPAAACRSPAPSCCTKVRAIIGHASQFCGFAYAPWCSQPYTTPCRPTSPQRRRPNRPPAAQMPLTATELAHCRRAFLVFDRNSKLLARLLVLMPKF